MTEQLICVGVITGPHGVRGQVRVKSFTVEPADVAAYGPLRNADGARLFALELTGSAKGVLLARIEGVSDRDAAETLKGTELYVPRDVLPNADDDEFYHADLIGLSVALEDGSAFGTVRALHDFGAGDMIEVDLAAGDSVVLPFTNAVVPVIDLDTGRIVVVPPQEEVADSQQADTAEDRT